MLLEPEDLQLFFRLHRTFMFFVNQRLKVISADFATAEAFAGLSPELRLKVRDAWLANIDLTDSFVAENPAHVREGELDIVRSWRHPVAGKFYVFRELAKYTVFLSTSDPAIAYGVVALSQPFEELIGPYLPVLTETVLLPFKDKIVYDGLINRYSISFGPGIRRSLNESFREAKARRGIVTSLPMSDKPIPAKIPKTKSDPMANPKDQTAAVLRIIVQMIDQFCHDHLNEEYAILCRRLAEKLARKRPSPLLGGKTSSWACGIVRTIGWVNFLDDRSQKPHLKLTAIDAYFGVGESTGQAKSMSIRKMLKIGTMDPAWTLPGRIDQNPMVWMIEIDGFVVDARFLKREIQEEALRQGLIPYIPQRPQPSQEDEAE